MNLGGSKDRIFSGREEARLWQNCGKTEVSEETLDLERAKGFES